MKQNVWIINHYASSMMFDKGGRHYFFSKYLTDYGYKPVVFCSNVRHGLGEEYFPNVQLWHEAIAEDINVPFIFIKSRTYHDNGKQRILNMVDFYFNVIKAAKQYSQKTGKPDVIYASSVHPLALIAGIKLAKFFKIKCICEIRDLWPESIVAYSDCWSKKNLLIKLLYLGEKMIYKKADSIIMTWPGGYDYIIEQGWQNQIPHSKVAHISNGVDLTSFSNLAVDSTFFDKDLSDLSKCKFIYTGSIRKVNNLGLIVEAAKILKQRGNKKARICIYGDGDEQETLKNYALKHQIDNICFKGKIPKNLVPAALSHADVSLLHNTSTILDKYGQSQNKFFEYLGVGHPILMTYSVGHSIIKQRKCGIELDIQSPEKIADAIEFFCNLPKEQYNIYCKNALNCASEFSYKNLVVKLISVIEN